MNLNDFPPMLLDERPLPLTAPGWIYEIMYDGYLLTAMFGDGECQLRTRGGADATRCDRSLCRGRGIGHGRGGLRLALGRQQPLCQMWDLETGNVKKSHFARELATI